MSGFAKFLLVVAVLAIGAGGGVYYIQKQQLDDIKREKTSLQNQLSKVSENYKTAQSAASKVNVSYKSRKGVTLEIYTPAAGSSVKSPLYILGRVPGSWTFEGSFPIRVVDEMGNLLGDTQGKLLGEWTTDEMVPFSAKLSWSGTPQGKLKLIIENDNASGLSANEDSLSIDLAK